MVSYSETPLHIALSKDEWNLKDIQKLLERDSSLINEWIFSFEFARSAPLLFVLRNDNCSVDVVKLLLKYHADVNGADTFGMTPLYIALSLYRGDAVVTLLIEKGANVKDPGVFGQSYLCAAFLYGASKDVIEMLLNKGCPMNTCEMHGNSVLHCAVSYPKSGLKSDVLKLLIERGANINAVDGYNHNVVCFALQRGNEAYAIKLLLEAGGDLNSCLIHSSPLFCATDYAIHAPLKLSVIELLLEAGTCIDEADAQGFTPLQNALYKCRYEPEAIALLLDQFKGVDMWKYSLLHLAVRNENCLLSVVKLLIEQGIEVDEGDSGRIAALHEAVRNPKCQPCILTTLLQNGAKVDHQAVVLALRVWHHPKIFKVLLADGASISESSLCSLVETVLNQYKNHPDRLVFFKLFLKYYFLKMSYPCVPSSECHQQDHRNLLIFKEKCVHELLKMKSQYVSQFHTLYEFLNGSHSPYEDSADRETEEKMYDFDQLLGVISNEAFPFYFDIVSYKVGRPSMETKLLQVQVYTVKYSPDNACVEEKSVLCHHCMLEIAQYLTNADLLRWILTYFNGDHSLSNARANEKRKISLEKPKLLRCKLPRLCKK